MIVYLSYDDFHDNNHRMEYLKELRNYFNNFKISVFAIPSQTTSIWLDKEWLELCVHGFSHLEHEDLSISVLEALSKYYQKIYKAPFWQLNNRMYERLVACDYKIMLNPEDPKEHRYGIYFNWNLKNEPDLTKSVLVGHGHIQNVCDNGLEESLERVKMLPKDTEFRLLSKFDGRWNA